MLLTCGERVYWIMKLINSILIVITLVCGVCGYDSVELTDVVVTEKGPVRGKFAETVQHGIIHSAFKGIPYAKPPTGYLRFKAPVEVEPWTEPLLAINKPNSCPQLKFQTTDYIGNEDCLYLNVYTPKIKFDGTHGELLAVMVWIHGGAFVFGSGDYNADFLIEENVVVVTMNYRLGALGFLSLNHANATGNAGLKDQVLALKWVKENIQNFGGDPHKVTIFGQSAGGAAVEFHKLSKLSDGLFHQSIAMSGSALNFWAFSPTQDAVNRGFYLGRQLGISTNSKEKLLDNLYRASAEELVFATIAMTEFLIKVPFKPTYEDKYVGGDEAFLTECAVNLYKSGNFRQLPHMMGFTDAEAIHIAPYLEWKKSNRSGSLMSSVQLFNNILNENLDIFIELNDESNYNTLSNLITIASDIAFVIDIDRTQRYLSKGTAPVYYYRNSFDYDSSLHKIDGILLNGTAHADDIAHVFWMPDRNQTLDENSEIGIHRKKMARMWANFAKYGAPTPRGNAEPLLNVAWLPSGKNGDHLAIGNGNLFMGSRPVDKFVRIAQRLIKLNEAALNGCR